MDSQETYGGFRGLVAELKGEKLLAKMDSWCRRPKPLSAGIEGRELENMKLIGFSQLLS